MQNSTMTIDAKLNFKQHIEYTCGKVSATIVVLVRNLSYVRDIVFMLSTMADILMKNTGWWSESICSRGVPFGPVICTLLWQFHGVCGYAYIANTVST